MPKLSGLTLFEQKVLDRLDSLDRIAAALESQPISYALAEATLDATECTTCCHRHLPPLDEDVAAISIHHTYPMPEWERELLGADPEPIVGQRVTVASDIRKGDRFQIAGVWHVAREDAEPHRASDVGVVYFWADLVAEESRLSSNYLALRPDAVVTVYRESAPVAEAQPERESYTVEQIREAFAKHASEDDWGVKSFYDTSLIAALRGEFDKPDPVAEREMEVVDLVAALRASVEAAKKRREEAAAPVAIPQQMPDPFQPANHFAQFGREFAASAEREANRIERGAGA